MEDLAISQTELFDTPHENAFKFLTTRLNLMSILDAGYVSDASSSWRYSPDSRELFEGAIPLFTTSVPSDFQSIWNAEDADFPVILEFDTSLADWLTVAQIDADSTHLLIVQGVIPLVYLNKIIFRQQKDIDDYKLRVLSDSVKGQSYFSVMGTELCFSAENMRQTEIKIPCPANLQFLLGPVIAMFRYYDFSVGSVKLFLPLLDAALSFDSASKALFGHKNYLLGSGEVSEKRIDNDAWIFSTVRDYCLSLESENVFDQDAFVSHIRDSAVVLDSEVQAEINKWLDYTQQILDSMVDVPSLPDQGNIVKRAVLLLALRPTPKRFDLLKDSTLVPGNMIKLVGSWFLGSLCGHQNLGCIKGVDDRTYFKFIAALINKIVDPARPLNLSIELADQTGITLSYAVKFDGSTLLRWSGEPDPVLAQVYYQAKGANYTLHYDHEIQSLWCQLALPGDRKQIVYVSRGRPNTNGDVVLRFTSPCYDIRGKGNKLLKDQLYDLLRRNSDPGMYCRFAIDEALGAITVSADQIQSTMDEKELIAHLEYVASTADAYEKEFSDDDRY